MSADHGNPLPSYMKVFYALLVLTVLTVLAAKSLHFPAEWGTPGDILHVAIGIAIAVVKVIAVMYIFMHLKFDHPFLRFFVYVPVFLFLVLGFALNILESWSYTH
ncbi:MAG: cytochrome C oxidase subunit IV family protein [Candidatus Kapaibacteriota bacterium]|jgi:caa(3)-type oxidase subunit IV